MNLLTFRSSELDSDLILRVSGDRAQHLSDALGAAEGSVLRVGEIDGSRGTARVVEVKDGIVALKVESMPEPCVRPSIDLILAMPRPQMLKHVLQSAAMIGVDRLMLIRARRVEKSYFFSPVLEDEKIFHYLRLGLEQAVSTALPRVSIHRRFMSFIDEEYADQDRMNSSEESIHRLIAHPKAELQLSQLGLEGRFKKGQRRVLAVGPEGGWDDYEVDQFVRCGFVPFNNGARVLRVEQAVTALLSQLALLDQMGIFNGMEQAGSSNTASGIGAELY